ncbi:MAG: bifunctional diaminohydroxyphosphoribosylaminopyrimidine deaminase/5-amino-6-(5-phosphoribosylamino)uracil reductase RibD [bacterium]
MMRQALSLAQSGRGKVSPNPLVGAIVVNSGKIVGRGYHDGVGRPHAEVNALSEAGNLARGAIMYVTLEPCAVWGRTPPCTDAIIHAGISKVFVATEDPNPSVSGRGMGLLRESGIQVEVGLLEDEARRVNETYMKFMKTGLPFVTLKVAATIDGKIATKAGESRWITEDEARDRVQSLRMGADAILVGVGTVLADDPSLTVRDTEIERKPRRIVLDSKLRTPRNAKLLDGNAPTVIATTVSPSRTVENAEVWSLESDPSGRVSLNSLLQKAGQQRITSILVEGGAEVFSSFLNEHKVDKLMFFVAPKIMGCGIDAFGEFAADRLQEAFLLDIADICMVGSDILITAYPRQDSCGPKVESDS